MLKKFKFFALASILFSSLIISCGDDNDSSGGCIPALGKLSATIDGTKWEGTNATGIMINAANVTTLTIAGSKVDLANPTASEILSVVVYAPLSSELTVGDFTIGDNIDFPKGQITYTIGTSAQNTWVATSGTVSITKITDTNFQGTFNGTLVKGEETKTLTNGGFNVAKTTF